MQKKGRAGTSRAGKIALYGMMTALAFLLSYVETLIPLNLGVPGVKLGLANLASIVSCICWEPVRQRRLHWCVSCW